MKRDFLKELGLTDEQVSSVMAANGEDITREQAKAETQKKGFDELNEQFTKYKTEAEAKIAGFADHDQIVKERDELLAYKTKTENENRFNAVLGNNKPLNDFTREGLFGQFVAATADPANKGKTDADLFGAIIKDKERDYFGTGVTVRVPSNSDNHEVSEMDDYIARNYKDGHKIN